MDESEMTPPKQTHSAYTTPDSEEVQVVDALRNSEQGFIFEVIHVWGRTTTERRISKRLPKVRWALTCREGDLTPAQKQALVMVYGAELTPYECAKRLGVRRQSFHDRLRSAESTVDRLYEQGGRRQWKKGRPNARLRAPDGAAWIEQRARETLDRGASYVWGDDLPPRDDSEFLRWLDEEQGKDELREDLRRIAEGPQSPDSRTR
jgi:hypothetical protein